MPFAPCCTPCRGLRLSGQVSAQGISGRTAGMRGTGPSTPLPKAGWLNSRGCEQPAARGHVRTLGCYSRPAVSTLQTLRCQGRREVGPGFWAAPQARSTGPGKERCPDAKNLCHTIGNGLEATILRSPVPALSARRIADTPVGVARFHAKSTS